MRAAYASSINKQQKQAPPACHDVVAALQQPHHRRQRRHAAAKGKGALRALRHGHAAGARQQGDAVGRLTGNSCTSAACTMPHTAGVAAAAALLARPGRGSSAASHLLSMEHLPSPPSVPASSPGRCGWGCRCRHPRRGTQRRGVHQHVPPAWLTASFDSPQLEHLLPPCTAAPISVPHPTCSCSSTAPREPHRCAALAQPLDTGNQLGKPASTRGSPAAVVVLSHLNGIRLLERGGLRRTTGGGAPGLWKRVGWCAMRAGSPAEPLLGCRAQLHPEPLRHQPHLQGG